MRYWNGRNTGKIGIEIVLRNFTPRYSNEKIVGTHLRVSVFSELFLIGED